MNPTGGTGGGSHVPQDPFQAPPSQQPIMYPNQATNDTTAGAGGFSFGTMPTPPPPGGVAHAGAQTQQQPDFGPMQGSDGGGDDLNMGMNMGIQRKSLEYLNNLNESSFDAGNRSKLLNKQEKKDILSSYYTAKKNYQKM